MNQRFDGKVVVITGGAGAIGRVTGQAFAAEGAMVVLVGRGEPELAEAAAEICDAGGRAGWVLADVTKPAEVSDMVDKIAREYGGLHIAFNCAGITGANAPVAELEPGQWSSVVEVNLTGVFLAMKYEIGHMRSHGGGVIVNTGSNIGAHTRRPGMAAYAASKAAVSVLTKTAAREYIAEGIRINAISPGASDTPMSYRSGESQADRDIRVKAAVPAGRVSDPTEVAAAVLWLASADASFVIGHDLVVDGGATA